MRGFDFGHRFLHLQVQDVVRIGNIRKIGECRNIELSAGSTLTVSEKKGDEISDENSEESENKQIEEEEPH